MVIIIMKQFFLSEINNSDVPDVLRRFDVFVIPSPVRKFWVRLSKHQVLVCLLLPVM